MRTIAPQASLLQVRSTLPPALLVMMDVPPAEEATHPGKPLAQSSSDRNLSAPFEEREQLLPLDLPEMCIRLERRWKRFRSPSFRSHLGGCLQRMSCRESDIPLPAVFGHTYPAHR